MKEGTSGFKAEELYIPGGFDLLHKDHKTFILNCINEARKTANFDRVVVGLISDRELNFRGKHRPFFSFEWRKEDIERWWKKEGKDFDLAVELDQLSVGNKNLLIKNPNRLVVTSTANRGHKNIPLALELYGGIVFVPPINEIHTTDIENQLTSARDNSNCLINTVGAVLLRNGKVEAVFSNGGKPGSCEGCNKYIELMKVLKQTGEKRPTPIPCDFPHAEESCLKVAESGDYLLTTTSPCRDCAEFIVDKGIERVVFMEPYHDTKPIDYLMKKSVKVRQAGHSIQVAKRG